MGAAKECSLRNIVMSVATPLAGRGKFFPLFIYPAVEQGKRCVASLPGCEKTRFSQGQLIHLVNKDAYLGV